MARKTKKWSHTGTERSSGVNQLIERIGGSGGGSRVGRHLDKDNSGTGRGWGKIISDLFKGKGKSTKSGGGNVIKSKKMKESLRDQKPVKRKVKEEEGAKIREVNIKSKKSLEGQKPVKRKMKREKEDDLSPSISSRNMRRKQKAMEAEGRKNRRQKKKSLYEPWLND